MLVAVPACAVDPCPAQLVESSADTAYIGRSREGHSVCYDCNLVNTCGSLLLLYVCRVGC